VSIQIKYLKINKMETKKSNQANLEKKRSVFFQTGLLLALCVAFVAFEWRVAPQVSDKQWIEQAPGVDWTDIVRTPPPTIPPPPPPVSLQSYGLEIVDNDIPVDVDPSMFDIETSVGNRWPEVFFDPVHLTVGEDSIFLVVEEKPSSNEFRQFIRDNMVYPQRAIDNNLFGKVLVQFVIDEHGNVSNAQVVRSVDPELDKEALRLITSPKAPKWTPGRQQGKAVKVKYTFPISFQLSNSL
jgi:protein TonB